MVNLWLLTISHPTLAWGITAKYYICLSHLLMTEVVQSFIVGHWAVSRELTVPERHVATTNIIEIENHDERRRPGMPRELYKFLVKTFSLEGDLIFYLGIGNGK